MFLEFGHGLSHRFDPLTVCAYDVDVADVIDLRTDTDCKNAGIVPTELSCPWALDVAEGREPASWKLANKFQKAGIAGLLVRSYAHGAKIDLHHNLVLWKWGTELPHKVTVHDSSLRLPHSQESWK